MVRRREKLEERESEGKTMFYRVSGGQPQFERGPPHFSWERGRGDARAGDELYLIGHTWIKCGGYTL
jgi:hypothetical protein